ncbi:MAG TPA: L-arabinose isomerase [Candidatus Aquilonibacter sp.]|jgi:L-arabinose isomerase|nr:L-arabinose isomerase [Candidatus Aquilonibacter sp.]
MIDFANLEVWFVTGSQHLYGPETLKQVGEHATTIVRGLGKSSQIPVKIVAKPVMTGHDSIHELCLEANRAKNCIGLITWMHTFSPARMWIAGLRSLDKPLLHLHTQFNEQLPWSSIDMDFMNLNQSAHGDREFGFIGAKMRLKRKVVVGFWQDAAVHGEIGAWSRAACAWHDSRQLTVARIGDNMRNVAVTDGNKVNAGIMLGYSVNGYGVGDVAKHIQQATDAEVDKLTAEYDDAYTVVESMRPGGSRRQSMRDAARIELGLRAFLQEVGAHAFTDTFEDLHGLKQLPGIAVQRLMAEGYGFGAEGDWKTSALVRAVKVMSHGLEGGASFMEDYTYHLPNGGQILGAHMLEVCPSIADNKDKPAVEVHPLGIGGKEDPVRLVFTAAPGNAVNASLVDMGNRFRLIVNEVNIVRPEHSLPKLPVARALWIPEPNLKVSATTWILAGGAHHTALSRALTTEHLEDFAEMAGMEFLLIGPDTTIREFKKESRWNDLYYHLARGL